MSFLIGCGGFTKDDYFQYVFDGLKEYTNEDVESMRAFNQKFHTDISYYRAFHTRSNNTGNWGRTDDRLSGYNGQNGPLQGQTKYVEFKICNFGNQNVILVWADGSELPLVKGQVLHRISGPRLAWHYSGSAQFRLYVKD